MLIFDRMFPYNATHRKDARTGRKPEPTSLTPPPCGVIGGKTTTQAMVSRVCTARLPQGTRAFFIGPRPPRAIARAVLHPA